MNAITPDKPTIGHNLPSEEQAIRDNLIEKHRSLQPRAAELLADGAKLPEVIAEDQIPQVTDFIGSVKTHMNKIEQTRKVEKDPYTRGGQIIDGYFKKMGEPLETLWSEAKRRLDRALNAKADRVRKQQEAEAARIRAEAAERQRIAEEERKKKEAELAEARARAEAAEKKQREESERLQREIDEAERKRKESEAKTEQAEIERRAAIQRQVDAAAAEAAANVQKKRAEEDAAKKESAAADAQRDAERADRQLDSAAAKEHRVQTAKTSEFARTRGEYGKLGTLQEFWNHTGLDRDTLDKRAIWKFISDEALEQAVGRYIGSFAGNEPKPIKGVKFFKDSSAVVR